MACAATRAIMRLSLSTTKSSRCTSTLTLKPIKARGVRRRPSSFFGAALRSPTKAVPCAGRSFMTAPSASAEPQAAASTSNGDLRVSEDPARMRQMLQEMIAAEMRRQSAPASEVAKRQPVPAEGREEYSNLPLSSVVKIFATCMSPNFSMPWQMKRQSKSTSSGFAIEGRRIVTNAHSVANQTSVQVRKHGDAEKYTARVLAVAHECDLALLTVEEEGFWAGVEQLEFGGIPDLQDQVTVIGYPTGGDNICVTEGVVSRIEVQTYSHTSTSLLAVQIDAAINSGNSGGPALRDGKLIGVAFETLVDAENIGYIIPVPVLEHFLEDIARHDRYTGFCSLGFYWQTLENPDLRKSCGMKAGQTGVYVNRVLPLAAAQGRLQEGDVVLAVDGVQIANDGTIPFRKGERVLFRHLVTLKFLGDTTTLRVLRGGAELSVDLPLDVIRPLVPVHMYDRRPRYLIFGGLVFVELSRPYLQAEYGSGWESKAPVRLCSLAFYGLQAEPGEQVVVLSHVLSAECNTGYQSFQNVQVTHFNGAPVKNLAELMQLVSSCGEPYGRFALDCDKTVVIDMAKARACEPTILRQHAIPAPFSPGLLEASSATADVGPAADDIGGDAGRIVPVDHKRAASPAPPPKRSDP
eukprot:tig00001065_g6725.t1